MLDQTSTIIEVQRATPINMWPSVIASVITGGFTVCALFIANRHNLHKAMMERKEQAVEDEKKRLFEVRKGVYVEAGSRLRKASEHLANLSEKNLGVSEEILAPLEDARQSIEAMMAVCSKDMLTTVISVEERMGIALLRLLKAATPIGKISIDIAHHGKNIDELGDAISRRKTDVEAMAIKGEDISPRLEAIAFLNNRDSEELAEEQNKVSELYARKLVLLEDFWKVSRSEIKNIRNLRADLLAKTREELGLETDSEALKTAMSRAEKEAEREFKKVLKKVDEEFGE